MQHSDLGGNSPEFCALILKTLPPYLHSHDQATGDVPHFVHHAVRAAAQLRDLLQVIGLHLKILQPR